MDAIGVEKVSFSDESLGGWITVQLAHDHPEKVSRTVLNTVGGIMANPQVMERLYALSMETAKAPSQERVKARLEWLMADATMMTNDLIRIRQASFQQPDRLAACEMNMALQDLETAPCDLCAPPAKASPECPETGLLPDPDPDPSDCQKVAAAKIRRSVGPTTRRKNMLGELRGRAGRGSG